MQYKTDKLLLMATNKSSNHAVADEGDSKEYILAGLAEACKEIKLAREGKIKGIDASDYIEMLKVEDSILEA